MSETIFDPNIHNKCVLVGLVNNQQPPNKSKEYLDELAFLASTLGIETAHVFTQKLERSEARSFVRKGKLEEIVAYMAAYEIPLVIFDDELTSTQVRNLERELKDCVILDRSSLILEIFQYRAQTAQAKTQVELARYQYMLPRLTRMWTHLERQKGGIGMRGGSGEKEIETDRRVIRDKITLLKKKLEKIEQQSETRRKSRSGTVRVALVGYTNVGKSTIMRLLSKEDVFAENKLFATVDSTVRKVFWKDIPFLLSDTVGFIRKLPTTLIECFKSTLAEIVEADVLLHVVDISHPAHEEQMDVVRRTLVEIGAGEKTVITVYNKIDAYSHDVQVGQNYVICPPTIEELQESYLGRDPMAIFISAFHKNNVESLRALLYKEVEKVHKEIYPNYLPSASFKEDWE